MLVLLGWLAASVLPALVAAVLLALVTVLPDLVTVLPALTAMLPALAAAVLPALAATVLPALAAAAVLPGLPLLHLRMSQLSLLARQDLFIPFPQSSSSSVDTLSLLCLWM